MTDKLFRRIGLGALIVVPVLAFGVVEGTSLLIPPTSAENSSRTAEKSDSVTAAKTLATVPAASSALPAANAIPAVVEAPANQGSADFPIHDSDLKSLGAMVDLGNAAQGTPNKEHWTRAISIAQSLLQGPCDCEQRNWLTHFVTMGNAALSGSPEYYRLAHIMPKMALNAQMNTHY